MTLFTHGAKPTPDDLSGQIDWLLAHPGVSEWLKMALRSSEDCDPVTLLNDLELLRLVAGRRAEEQIVRLFFSGLSGAG